MRCENNLMETTLKKNMSLYEEDQQPEGGRWRKILRYVLILSLIHILNPFNQPGVESYKRNMFALLGKPGYEAEREELLKRL